MDWLLRYVDPSVEWDYALVTLMVRFIGVFVVMFVMQIALQLSSRLVMMYERRGESAAAPPPPAATAAAAPSVAVPGVLDDTELAAIGLALALEARPPTAPFADVGSGSSPWAVAGRMQQLHRAPRRG